MVYRVSFYLYPLEIADLFVAEAAGAAMTTVVINTIRRICIGSIARSDSAMMEARLGFEQGGPLRQSLQSLPMKLNFTHLGPVLILLVILRIVHLNVIT
jgi:hypothetical protein